MNVHLDIETIPAQPEEEIKSAIAETIQAPAAMSKPETIRQWHDGKGKYAGVKDAAIEEAYRKTALDGGKGEILSIAWAVGDEAVSQVSRSLCDSEYEMLRRFFTDLSKELLDFSNGRPPFFIGHNIKFDLKFIYRRCAVMRIIPAFKLPFRGRHGSDYFCNSEAWCEFREYISQDNLCKTLGIAGKPNDIDGSKVWDFVKAGDTARVFEYNVDDVEKVRSVYNRLTFNGAAA